MHFKLTATFIIASLFVGFTSAAETESKAKPEAAKERKFGLTYAAKILDAPSGAKVRAWIPVPPSSGEQSVKALTSELPAKGEEGTEDRFGNKMGSSD